MTTSCKICGALVDGFKETDLHRQWHERNDRPTDEQVDRIAARVVAKIVAAVRGES